MRGNEREERKAARERNRGKIDEDAGGGESEEDKIELYLSSELNKITRSN